MVCRQGEYLSALSNNAALQGKANGYLVWGMKRMKFLFDGYLTGGSDRHWRTVDSMIEIMDLQRVEPSIPAASYLMAI